MFSIAVLVEYWRVTDR